MTRSQARALCGAALYAADEEADGKIRCTADCLSFWTPVAATGTPTCADDVTGKLDTMRSRPRARRRPAAPAAAARTSTERAG
jgi:hypothetical protein